jgi:alanine dehydrogenase
MLLLTNQDVLQVLTMGKCLEAVEESTRRIGRGQLVKWNAGRVLEEKGGFGGGALLYTLRLRPTFDLVDGVAILRINSWANVTVDMYGKARHVIAPIAGERNPHNSEKSGWLHLYDMGTGRLLAIVQDRDIQVMRVGSVGGLCAKYIARSDAQTIGLIGAGWMARALLLAHCLVRDIKSVKVFSPNPSNRSKFCEQMKGQLGIEVSPVSSAQEAVRAADIVISGTNSAEPTFDPEWIEQGMHVYCVTGAEYDERMVKKADLVAWTYPESSQYDYGGDETNITGDPQEEKLAARKRGYSGYRTAGWRLLEKYASKRVYLTDIIEGRASGRSDEKQITFSPSPAGGSSLVIRFAVLLPRLCEEAKRRGIGHDLPDEWFHQEDETYPTYRLR